MKNMTLQVEGMSCQHCVNSIEGALKSIGVSGKVDLNSNTVEITYNEDNTTLDQIKETIEEQGYDVM
ncbi:copper ion binding protein (plasmid) [Paenibacillus urinalis]|uniref:Copper ion binding protein n=1 Tax=Paenibacillus urinalis TaxID=521520 RepID=A0AAX3N6K9_9BACL|nr:MULTISPECIES: copper ion binding protein [Paenibacillus]MCM3131057.1 copper ion binding protein [Paenibacillus sp. MER 78]WDH85355.1 copper ion binding protein [Paenibacillus urinalis]WDH95206.1 copper ion binding protein [Paenibacillus urinalis]WDI05319.1 copper ion binding protein [Paenibacillus urinalis]